MRFRSLDLYAVDSIGSSLPSLPMDMVGLMPVELDLKFVASNEIWQSNLKKVSLDIEPPYTLC